MIVRQFFLPSTIQSYILRIADRNTIKYKRSFRDFFRHSIGYLRDRKPKIHISAYCPIQMVHSSLTGNGKSKSSGHNTARISLTCAFQRCRGYIIRALLVRIEQSENLRNNNFDFFSLSHAKSFDDGAFNARGTYGVSVWTQHRSYSTRNEIFHRPCPFGSLPSHSLGIKIEFCPYETVMVRRNYSD